MMPELKPYPEMKDSGVKWLGGVPAHWGLYRLRNIAKTQFSNVDKHSKEGEFPVRLCNYSDVYYSDHINSEMDFMKATATSEEIERFRLVAEDVLITKDSETWDDIGIPALVANADPDLICGYHLAQLRPYTGRVNGAFLHRALSSRGVAHQFFVRANGVTRFGLSQIAIKSVWFTIPPLSEQIAITRYLDHATDRIDRYIRAKEKLIKLLKEQKQVIIHEAVTGRFDVRTGKPYPAYKDSGVEWLGNIPGHWEMPPNKSILSHRKTLVGEHHMEFKLLSLTKRGVIVRDISTGQGKFSADPGTCQEVRVGDLVFCLFDVPETPRTVGLSAHHGMITGAYTIFECTDCVLKRFFESFYIAIDDRKLLAPLYSGLRNTIPPSSFLRVKTPIPPRSEQTAIARFLDKTSSKIDSSIVRAQRQIDLLCEYRTRLIADVVTGKVDVR